MAKTWISGRQGNSDNRHGINGELAAPGVRRLHGYDVFLTGGAACLCQRPVHRSDARQRSGTSGLWQLRQANLC
jgi:hypothetical protein